MPDRPGDASRRQVTPERCPFCSPPVERVAARNDLAVAIRDAYPVNPGHTQILPVRHVPTWFEATDDERQAILDLEKERLDHDLSPDGYNVGLNAGQAAGQTVMHLHIHLIPRFCGDMDDPRGGVRLVIPEKGNYKAKGRILDACHTVEGMSTGMSKARC